MFDLLEELLHELNEPSELFDMRQVATPRAALHPDDRSSRLPVGDELERPLVGDDPIVLTEHDERRYRRSLFRPLA
jgi:hypothetical protein